MIPVTSATHFQSRSRRSASRVARASIFSTRIISFVLLAILALLYIAESSQGATKRIEVQSLSQKAQEYENDIDTLKLEQLRLQSLTTTQDAIQKLPADSALEPVTNLEFLSPQTSSTQPSPTSDGH